MSRFRFFLWNGISGNVVSREIKLNIATVCNGTCVFQCFRYVLECFLKLLKWSHREITITHRESTRIINASVFLNTEEHIMRFHIFCAAIMCIAGCNKWHIQFLSPLYELLVHFCLPGHIRQFHQFKIKAFFSKERTILRYQLLNAIAIFCQSSLWDGSANWSC